MGPTHWLLCSGFLHFCLHCPYYSFIFIISLGYIMVFFLTPFFFFWYHGWCNYLCSLKYLFFFWFSCKTHPHVNIYEICLKLWDPAKLSQPTTEKNEKRRRRRNPAPKPTKQGRKIVDLICGDWNRWVSYSFVLDLRCHRWQEACQLAGSMSDGDLL